MSIYSPILKTLATSFGGEPVDYATAVNSLAPVGGHLETSLANLLANGSAFLYKGLVTTNVATGRRYKWSKPSSTWTYAFDDVNRIYATNGVPGNTVGYTGDMAFDYASGTFYHKLADASWTAMTNFTVPGALTVNGSVTLGDTAGDLVSIIGTLTSHILFNADNTKDIGETESSRPRDIHVGRYLKVAGMATLSGGATITGITKVVGTAFSEQETCASVSADNDWNIQLRYSNVHFKNVTSFGGGEFDISVAELITGTPGDGSLLDYAGSTFIISVFNATGSDGLNVVFNDTAFKVVNGSTVVLNNNEGLSYSGVILSDGTNAYMYGVIAPIAKNLL